jgi:hypothetical protein
MEIGCKVGTQVRNVWEPLPQLNSDVAKQNSVQSLYCKGSCVYQRDAGTCYRRFTYNYNSPPLSDKSAIFPTSRSVVWPT